MPKQSELARVLAHIDAEIEILQAARQAIVDAQAQRATPKPHGRGKGGLARALKRAEKPEPEA